MPKAVKASKNSVRFILALDPSGSFNEGKGTTGYCIFDTMTHMFLACGSIYAKDFNNMEEYWDRVLTLIDAKWHYLKRDMVVVCEDYLLYATKLQDQINSRMETPKLIGCIQHFCYKNNIPYRMQTASEVKKRWANHILAHKGYIKIINARGQLKPTSGDCTTYSHHSLDAIRHAIHYATFKNK